MPGVPGNTGNLGDSLPPPEKKEVRFGHEAREILRAGIDIVANTVGSTLGPRGRNVAYARTMRAPQITNDGVTVANEIEKVNNIFHDLGIQIMKEAASKTSSVTEDGTTTATVLAQAIVHRGIYNIAAGANAMMLRDGVQAACDATIESIRDMARPIETETEIKHIATISGDDVELGTMVGEVMSRVGRDGLVMVDYHRRGVRLEARYIEGMQIDKGWVSPYFVTDTHKMQGNLENAHVLLTDQDIWSPKQLEPILDKVAESNNRNLLLVSNTLVGPALTFVLQNKLRGNLNVVAIQAPSYADEMREILEDLAVLTGATVVSRSLGIRWDDVPLEWLGFVKRVVANREATILLEGSGREADVQDRQNQLRAQLEEETRPAWVSKMERRIATLGGSVGVIAVGGVTEQEMQHLKDKADDAVGAAKVALRDGIVPGGGTSLLRAQESAIRVSEKLSGDAAIGARIVADALEAPLRRIARNSGVNPSVVVNRVRKLPTWHGWDAVNNEYKDMYDAGIIDPAAIEIACIRASSSVGIMTLTTETIVCENRPIAVAADPDLEGTEMP